MAQFDMNGYDVWNPRSYQQDEGRRYFSKEGQTAPQTQKYYPPGGPSPVKANPTTPPETAYVAPFDYQTPAYGGPSKPTYNLPGVPTFNAPQFQAPDPNGIYADPSYQYRMKNMIGALDHAAAAQGATRTGGHLLDIQGKAGEMASQEYANIFDRAKDAYGLDYKRAYDQFAPELQDYQNRFGAATDAGNRGFDRSYDVWRYGNDDEFRREQMLSQLGLPE